MQLAEDEYDWTKAPWFFAEKSQEDVWGARYEEAELRRAVPVLAERYPPGFCRHYLETVSRSGFLEGDSDARVRNRRHQRGFGQLLLGLYGRWGALMPTLALGVDLAEVMPGNPDAEWLDRFRKPHLVFGTEFELQLWANSVRGAIPISRIPEQPAKTPDFVLLWREVRIAIEARTLAASEQDMVLYESLPFIRPWDRLPPDRAFHIEIAPEIRSLVRNAAGRAQYRSRIHEALATLETDRSRLERMGCPIGEHVVPRAGMTVIRRREDDAPIGAGGAEVAEQMTPEEQAERALHRVRRGAEKFRAWPDRSGHVGIVLLDIPRDYHPDALFSAIAADVEKDIATYRWTDAVICRSLQLHVPEDRDPALAYEHFTTYTIRLPWCMLPEHQLADLARPLLGSPHRLIMPMRRRGEPDVRRSAAEEMKTYVRTIELGRATRKS